MAAREAARPLQRLLTARGRPASLPLSYTTTGDATPWVRCSRRLFQGLASDAEVIIQPQACCVEGVIVHFPEALRNSRASCRVVLA